MSCAASRRGSSSSVRGRGDLVDAAVRRLAVEPGEEAADGGAVALVRRAGAGDLGGVLESPWAAGRDRRRRGRAAGGLDAGRRSMRRRRRVEADHARGAAAAWSSSAPNSDGSRISATASIWARAALVQLAAESMTSVGRPSAGNDGEGQRQRGVRHVGAADVEQPGDRVGLGQHCRRRPGLLQRRLHLGDLVGSAVRPA